MYGCGIQLVRGMNHNYGFAVLNGGTPDATKTVWGRIGKVLLGVSGGAPALYSEGSDMYSCRLNPLEMGTYVLIVKDASGNTLHSQIFKVVAALDAQIALGVQPPFAGLVPIYPVETMNAAGGDPYGVQASTINNGASNPVRAFISVGSNVIPFDTYIYGIRIATGTSNGIASLTSLRFFTADPADGSVRGISENFKGSNFKNPSTGATVAVNASSPLFKDIYFDRPVLARAGDWWGFEVDDTAASGASIWCYQVPSQANTITAGQKINVKNSALSLSGANAFAQFGTVTAQFQVQLLTNPPTGGLIGHSEYAGSPDTAPPFANTIYPYSRSQDLAVMVSDLLGVPFVNCAVGGSTDDDWIGASGHFEKIVAPLRPSIVIYDAMRNSLGNNPNLSVSAWLDKLTEIHNRCASYGIELMIFEPSIDYYATTTLGIAPQMEQFSAAARQWAEDRGVCTVPLYHALGQALSGGTSTQTGTPDRRRQLYRGNPNNFDNPDIGGDQRVHYSKEGRKAVAACIAAAIRRRAHAPSAGRDSTAEPTIISPNSQKTAIRRAGNRSKS